MMDAYSDGLEGLRAEHYFESVAFSFAGVDFGLDPDRSGCLALGWCPRHPQMIVPFALQTEICFFTETRSFSSATYGPNCKPRPRLGKSYFHNIPQTADLKEGGRRGGGHRLPRKPGVDGRKAGAKETVGGISRGNWLLSFLPSLLPSYFLSHPVKRRMQ